MNELRQLGLIAELVPFILNNEEKFESFLVHHVRNARSMPHLETIEWDYADQMRHVDKGNNTGQETWFVYDATS